MKVTEKYNGRLKSRAENSKRTTDRDDRSAADAMAYSQMQQVMTECRMLCGIGPTIQHEDLKSYAFKRTRKDKFTGGMKEEADAQRGGVKSVTKGGLTVNPTTAALLAKVAAPRHKAEAEARAEYVAASKARIAKRKLGENSRARRGKEQKKMNEQKKE